MEVKDKNFLVYGLGASGLSAYNFLNSRGANVCIYCDKYEDDLNISIIKNFEDVLKLKFDYAVISPGISIIGNNNIQKLKQSGVILISELELGYLFCKGKFIAVTGTNGKTTCVSLLHHILSKKYETFLCGNVGIPITSICDKTNENSVIVCETVNHAFNGIAAFRGKLGGNYDMINCVTTSYRKMASAGATMDSLNETFALELDAASTKNTLDFEKEIGKKLTNE